MKHSQESLALRRQHLSQQIAMQRADLAQAYRGLAKPLAYTQKVIVGAQALKQNAWAIALLPSVISLGFSFFGWKKKGKAGLLGLLGLAQDEEKEKRALEREAVARARKPIMKWVGHGWKLFKLYRRVRRYMP